MRPARKILALVVTGSVAAVKTFLLADELRARGFEVQFVVTESVWQFLKTEGKYAATAGQLKYLRIESFTLRCHPEPLGEGSPLMRHKGRSFARAQDDTNKVFSESEIILIAPASADFIRQLARGDTEIGRVIKDAGKPVFIAPAMNFMMWRHPAVQDNARRALAAGMKFIGPDCGDMACGDSGFGRMSEPAAIAEAVARGETSAPALVENAALPSRARGPCRRMLLVAFSSAPLPEGYDIQCIVPPENIARAEELQKATGHPVVSGHYQLYPRDGMEHIWLPEDSDVIVMHGLTREYAAGMAKGAGTSFIGCVYLATKRPVIVIPAAECACADIDAIRSHGAVITDAAGLSRAIENLEQDGPSGFEGKKFLVLGGHARETVDAFRFYTNTARPEDHGLRVARELEARGAEVTFLSAPGSAADLLSRVPRGDFEAVIQLAGISQFTCPAPVAHKIAKTGGERARLFEVAGNIDFIAGLRDIFGAAKVMGYDNFQEWADGAVTPLKHKIISLARRSSFPSPSHASKGAGPSLSRQAPGEGKRVIVTTGRTEEKLTRDGVVITNGSTGRQGRETARAFAEAGADVVLVSGPVALADVDHPRVRTVHVVSMRDMLGAVLRELEAPVDAFISVAAIADFSMREPLSPRLKPGETHRLEMTENPSIVEAAARHAPRPKTVVSFAAQSPGTVLGYAREKFMKSGVDLTVANPIDAGATTRDPMRNEVCFVYRKGGEIITEKLPQMPKDEVAREIVKKITSF